MPSRSLLLLAFIATPFACNRADSSAVDAAAPIASSAITTQSTPMKPPQNTAPPKNYLGVTSPIVFNGTSYTLSWSSHPSAAYYKHEYLPPGDDADKYKSMLLLELIVGDVTVKDSVAAKVKELDAQKKTNPMAQYTLAQKNGAYLLDFLATDPPTGRSVTTLERNVYLYKAFADKAGHKGVLLFGVSDRAYGDGVEPFLRKLSTTKGDLMNAVAAFAVPEVGISK